MRLGSFLCQWEGEKGSSLTKPLLALLVSEWMHQTVTAVFKTFSIGLGLFAHVFLNLVVFMVPWATVAKIMLVVGPPRSLRFRLSIQSVLPARWRPWGFGGWSLWPFWCLFCLSGLTLCGICAPKVELLGFSGEISEVKIKEAFLES